MTADVAHDPALVERVAKAIADGLGWDWNRSRTEHIPSASECCDDSARAVLDLLAAEGLLVAPGEREEREERLPPSNRNDWRGERRTVTTTTHPDGSTTVHTTAWQVTE